METIADLLNKNFVNLTRAERQLATEILKNYPVSGVGTIVTLAKSADVSVPTVGRLVKKLGFSGFPQFQETLRSELNATTSTPISKFDSWAQQAPTEHIVNRFTEAATDNVRQSLAQLDMESFDACCALMAQLERKLYISGGRITGVLADYLFLQMQVMRPNVNQIQATTSTWPHDLLDVAQDDVFVLYDVRRYENNTLKLAELAKEKGAKVILITDQWRSPIEKIADYSFNSNIVVPSAWDSMLAIMLLTETFIAAVGEAIWPEARARMEELEQTFDRTKLFRKFT